MESLRIGLVFFRWTGNLYFLFAAKRSFENASKRHLICGTFLSAFLLCECASDVVIREKYKYMIKEYGSKETIKKEEKKCKRIGRRRKKRRRRRRRRRKRALKAKKRY